MSRNAVLVKTPGCRCRIAHIENNLETFQRIVGGYIETISIHEDLVGIIDEEGKLKGKPVNFPIYGGSDHIVGTCIFAGVKGEEFCDISAGDMAMLAAFFGTEAGNE